MFRLVFQPSAPFASSSSSLLSVSVVRNQTGPLLSMEEIELRKAEFKKKSSSSSSSSLIPFESGNPDVEILTGTLRLFRETAQTQTTKTTTTKTTTTTTTTTTGTGTGTGTRMKMNPRNLPGERSDVIVVVAIPAGVPSSEFCEWIGGYASLLSAIRLVQKKREGGEEVERGEGGEGGEGGVGGERKKIVKRELFPGEGESERGKREGEVSLLGEDEEEEEEEEEAYMAILKFVSQDACDMFYSERNLQPFNSMEPYLARLLFVKEVTIQKSSGSIIPHDLKPNLSEEEREQIKREERRGEGEDPPLPEMLELPTCPVCLERLDSSVTGIVTSFCTHQFHCKCLAGWKREAVCPVCRHCPGKGTKFEESSCSVCGGKVDLWICVICGQIGCGRYKHGHANEHFQSTHHSFALELGSQRVWDYFGDTYVHRLVQDKGGEVVQLEEGEGEEDGEGAFRFKGKVSSIITEYNILLTSQLEAQREYYEKREKAMAEQLAKLMAEQRNQSSKQLQKKKDSSPSKPNPATPTTTTPTTTTDHHLSPSSASAQQTQPSQQEEGEEHLESAKLIADMAVLQSEVDKLKKECSKLQKEKRKGENSSVELGREVRFLKEVNESLESNQAEFLRRMKEEAEKKGKVLEEREKKIAELQEEIRDLSFFIEAQQTIAKENELKDGDVVVVPGKNPPGGGGSGRKGPKRGGRRK